MYLLFFVTGFLPAGQKTGNNKTISTALPKAKTASDIYRVYLTILKEMSSHAAEIVSANIQNPSRQS
jgi:hypothetical protein